jgi:hypothetical protein
MRIALAAAPVGFVFGVRRFIGRIISSSTRRGRGDCFAPMVVTLPLATACATLALLARGTGDARA